MKSLLFPLATTLFIATASQAADTIKCVAETEVTYQATPCTEGASTIVSADAAASPANVANRPAQGNSGTAAPGPVAPQSGHVLLPVAGPLLPVAGRSAGGNKVHSSRDQLQPGMSDLQVLNNRRWGKPQRITRTREALAWHEHWDYETGANGGKQLHFVNGTLVGIERLHDLVSMAPMAGMASVALMAER